MTTIRERIKTFRGIRAPFPYAGGKRRAAHHVWAAFGEVDTYLELFAGTCATLLNCPWGPRPREIVNDMDANIVNFWRAVKRDPEAVAEHADNPVFHDDLIATKRYIASEAGSLAARVRDDMDFYDARYAGRWVWAVSSSIGPLEVGGEGRPHINNDVGITRPQINPRRGGQGVTRLNKIPGTYDGVNAIPNLGRGDVKGVNSAIPHLTNLQGVNSARRAMLVDWMLALADRFRDVKVLNRPWDAALSDSILGTCASDGPQVAGIFLDPPYMTEGRMKNLYAVDSLSVAQQAFDFATAPEHDRLDWRIALCGYADDYPAFPNGWTRVIWSENQIRNGAENKRGYDRSEAIWFSPSCLTDDDWDAADGVQAPLGALL